MNNTDISDCYWFIEARHNRDTILLSNSEFLSFPQGLEVAREVSLYDDNQNNYDDADYTQPPATTMLPPRSDPPFIIASIFLSSIFAVSVRCSSDQNIFFINMKLIYDGWSSSGLVLFDNNKTSDQHWEKNRAIYSISNKLMVHSKPPVVRGNFVSSWKVSKVI